MRRRQFLAVTGALALAGMTIMRPAMADDTPQAVVESYLAAWNAHDSAKAASHFADNVSYYDASVGTPVEGREAAKTGVIDNFLNAVPDAVWKMKGAPIVQEGRVSFEWQFSGTNTGDWGDGTKATGKSFKFDGASSNYDGLGRNASDNDMLFGYLWLAF